MLYAYAIQLFSLTAMYQTRIYHIVSFVYSKNQTSCSSFIQTELGICIIVPIVSRNFSPAFQNIEAAFERCSTKVVVQQDFFLL